MKKLILLPILLSIFQNSYNQEYKIPTSGTDTITTCTGTISGQFGNYYNRNNGKLIVFPEDNNSVISLTIDTLNISSPDNRVYMYCNYGTRTEKNIAYFNSNDAPLEVVSIGESGEILINFTSNYYQEGDTLVFDVGCYDTNEIPLPDAEVLAADFELPSTVRAGDAIRYFYYRIKNNSPYLQQFEYSFFISEDSILSDNDIKTYNYVGALTLKPYETRYSYRTIEIPSHLDSNKYYILTVADPLNKLTEANETNNYTSKSIIVDKANVEVEVNYSNSIETIALGLKSRVSMKNYNSGESKVDSLLVEMYISSDKDLDVSDSLVFSDYTNTIYPQTNNEFYASVELDYNLNWEPGTYYLITKIDANNIYKEENETNNVTYKTVIIDKPTTDVKLLKLYPNPNYPNITAGSNYYFSLYYDIPKSEFSHKLGFYLSLDKELSFSEDSLIGTNYISNTNSSYNNNTYKSFTCQVPENIADGNYYLIATTIDDSLFNELNVTDNSLIKPVIVSHTTDYYDMYIDMSRFYINKIIKGANYSFISTVYGCRRNDNILIDYFLSQDTLIDNSDIKLGSDNIISDYTSPETFRQDISIAFDVPPGEYFFLLRATGISDNIDSNPENNTDFRKITIVEGYNYQTEDLVLTNFSCPDTINYNETNTIGELYNNGIVDFSYITSGIFLSTDTSLDAEDLLLGSSKLYPSSISSKQVKNFQFSIQIPDHIKEGNYYFITKTDVSNIIKESNENNNISYHPVFIKSDFQKDLKLYESVKQELVYPGEKILQEYHVYDFQNYNPPKGYFYYYLTKEPILPTTKDEIYIDTVTSFVSWGKAETFCKIPDTISEGKYYLWTYYENVDKHIDPDTLNNYAVHSIWVGAKEHDIMLSKLETDKNYILENKCHLNFTVTNNSSRLFKISEIDIYISEDSILDKENDQLVENIAINKILPESITDISREVLLKSIIKMHEYYIFATLDPDKYPGDTDIDNNTDTLKLYNIPSKADFAIESIENKDTITLESLNTFRMYIQNRGTESFSNNIYGGVYLSQDTIIDSSDILIDSKSQSYSSYYGRTYNFYNYGYFYSTFENLHGSYYLIYKIDLYDELGESIESNNTKYAPIYIRDAIKDIAIDSVSMPQSITPEINFESKIYMNNPGDLSLNTNKQIAILSTDSQLDLSKDIWLDISYDDYTINSNSTRYFYYGSKIPKEIAYGEYYMFIVVDFFNEQEENSKENNIYRTKIVVEEPKYDISVPSNLNSIELKPRQYNSQLLSITNLGNIYVSEVNYDIWLSKDLSFDTLDVLISRNKYGYQINPNETVSFNVGYQIPLQVDTGNYYILYQFSSNYDTLIDINPLNNNAIQQIKILYATTDLKMESYSSEKNQVDAGSYLNLACEIRNTGTEYTYSSTMAYMLSNDSIFDYSDYLLGTDYVSSMYSGNSSYESLNAYIPEGYSGTNYIIFVADYYNEIIESDESNNAKQLEIFINSDNPVEDTLDYSISELYVYPSEDTLAVYYQISRNTPQDEIIFLEFWLTENPDSIYNGSKLFFTDSVVMSSDQYTNSIGINISSIDSSYNYLTLKLIADDDYYDNNIRSIAIENGYIAPKDIAVYERYSADYWLQDNNYLVFDYYLNNNSNSNIDSSIISYYLFDDQIYNLGSRVFQLDKYNNSHITDSVLIEQTLNRELPIIKIIADPDNLIEETDEDNNSISYYFNYDLSSNDFDLMITDQSLHNNLATPGGIVSTSFGIKNTGKDPIKNTDVGIYISKDENWTFDDIFLDDYHIQEIIANDSALGVKSLIVPESIDTGYYFVLYIADFTNKFVETNELNNVESNLIYITNEIEHDLGLSVNLDSNYVKNDTLEYKGYLTNKGILNCQDIIINVYFSFDNNLDDFDVLLESIKIDELLFNDSTNLVDKITLPPGIQPGDYYLIFSVISDNEFYDSDFRNNVNATLFTFDQSSSVNFSQIANVNLYPNPAESEIYVTSDYNFTEAYIIELNGKVFNQTITGNSYKFNIDKLTNGMYILKLINNDKVVIKRFYKK